MVVGSFQRKPKLSLCISIEEEGKTKCLGEEHNKREMRRKKTAISVLELNFVVWNVLVSNIQVNF